jgi:8-oxo-dGTP pyrophosphatase MutT (NUDIX family)
MTVDKRGYRKSVRVIVTKGDKIALGTRKMSNGKESFHLFPGGGVDEGESAEQAAIKEVLEEVGMLVKDPMEIGVRELIEYEYPDPERRKLYRGAENVWVTASFVRMDSSLHGSEGDSFKFEWVTPHKAIELLESDPAGAMSEPKARAVRGFLSFRGVSLESMMASLPRW